MGVKKFTDFKKDRKSNEEEKSIKEKGKAPRRYIGASQPYDDEVNKEILAQEVTRKSTPDRQTNLDLTKKNQSIKDKSILPHEDSIFDEKGKKPSKGIVHLNDEEKANESKTKVKLVGKVAKFPKNTKASNAVNFLENVKIAKKDIFYILCEKQDNELQMIKYNQKEGVNLVEFVNELKKFYISKYKSRKDLIQIFEGIEVTGEDRFSVIKNIPDLVVDGKKVITKITEDLLKLLYK